MNRKIMYITAFCVTSGAAGMLLAGCIRKSEAESSSDMILLTPAVQETKNEAYRRITAAFTPISFQDFLDEMEAGADGIYYFGFETCPWCEDLVAALEKTGVELESVRYIEMRSADGARQYTDEQKEAAIQYIGEYMSENDEGVPKIYVPVLVRAENGTAVDGNVGTVPGHNPKERELTEAESAQLHDTLERILFG